MHRHGRSPLLLLLLLLLLVLWLVLRLLRNSHVGRQRDELRLVRRWVARLLHDVPQLLPASRALDALRDKVHGPSTQRRGGGGRGRRGGGCGGGGGRGGSGCGSSAGRGGRGAG